MLEVNENHLDKLTEALYLILKGKKANTVVLPEDYPDNELKQLTGYVNRLIGSYGDLTGAMTNISKGELDTELPRGDMAALQLLKGIQSSLRHLTWKTQRIASGDFDQQVDFMGDFSTAFNSMTRQLKEAFVKIEQQNELLKQAFEMINQEKKKADRLLLNILPVHVAEDLKATGQTAPETFENVTVFFSDVVGFTNMSSTLEPKRLIDELNDIFTAFDIIMENNKCERIKTIGDAYLAVTGMDGVNTPRAENIVDSAIQIIRYLEKRNSEQELKWKIRVGIHTGRVVGGVVGIKKYIYDVFGDTINTACRMEQNSEPMKINISEVTYALIKDNYESSGCRELQVKGKGLMKMYFVTDRKAPIVP